MRWSQKKKMREQKERKKERERKGRRKKVRRRVQRADDESWRARSQAVGR